MKKLIACIIVVLVFHGCAYISYMKDPFDDIPAFARVSDTMYRGGQPKAAGYERLKTLGIASVLSLSQDARRVEQEKSWADANGVLYYHIPLDLYVKPSDDQALRFLEIALDRKNLPIFIHCEDGRDRTGTMVALYRIVVDNWTIKNAYHEARGIGYWPYHGDDAPLKAFIHQVKDKPVYFQRARELLNEMP